MAFFIICNSLMAIIIKNAIFLDVNHLMFVRICLKKHPVCGNGSLVCDNAAFYGKCYVKLRLHLNLLKT